MSVGSIIALAPWLMQIGTGDIQSASATQEPEQAETEPGQTAMASPPSPAGHGDFRTLLSAPTFSASSMDLLQEQRVDAFIEPLRQANAVFARLSRPRPLQDARQAFEKRFTQQPQPVDLSRIHLKVHQITDGGNAEHSVVASPSVAELIVAHYSGRDINDLHARYPLIPGALYHGHGNAFQAGASTGMEHADQSTPLSLSAQDILNFIAQLPPNQATDIARQQAQGFATPGMDGQTPCEALGAIRRNQIGLEAQLQNDDQMLGERGKALVETIVRYPTAADLERAYPEASRRPTVYSLSVRDSNDTSPGLLLQGPFVMVQPGTAAHFPGGDAGNLLVLYVPGLGLKTFSAEPELMASISISPALRKCLPEVVQARLPEMTRYVFDRFEPIPADRNVFELSIQQQIDKQERDTRHRLEQAGKRGVDLVEFDWIAGHSSQDFRRSFEPPRFVSHPVAPRPQNLKALLMTPVRA